MRKTKRDPEVVVVKERARPDWRDITRAIIDLPADLSGEERDKRVLALCKGLGEYERDRILGYGKQLLKQRDPAWEHWEAAEELITFDVTEMDMDLIDIVGKSIPDILPHECYEAKGLKVLRREAKRGNKRAARLLTMIGA
jgi:hypothetical protein